MVVVPYTNYGLKFFFFNICKYILFLFLYHNLQIVISVTAYKIPLQLVCHVIYLKFKFCNKRSLLKMYVEA